jgi:hypothetical protein
MSVTAVSGRALLVAADPSVSLAALGPVFDDLVVAEVDRLPDELTELGPSGVVVVDGPLDESVTDTIVQHVATCPGSRLALGVSRQLTSLDGTELAGLRIVGGGRLGDLPVTWWAAADAPAAAAAPPAEASAPARLRGPAESDDAFAAHAHLLRAHLELAAPADERAGEAQPGGPAPTGTVTPFLNAEGAAGAASDAAPGDAPSRRTMLGYRLPLLLVFLAIGVALGVSLSQLWEGDVQAAATLLLLVAVALLLAWGVRAIRGLTVQLQGHAEHSARLSEELDRGMRQLMKRAQANDVRTVRMRDSLREIEARLAVVSSASASANAVRARLAAADAASDDE